jgi:hypothetical protein
VRLIFLLVSVFTAPLALAATDDDARLLEELTHAESLWKHSGLVNYSYVIYQGGVFGGADHKVRVRGDACRSIWRSNRRDKQDDVWRAETCESLRVEDVFAELRRMLSRGTVKTTVTFNDKYGYVEALTLEPAGDLDDQGWYVRMRSFRKEGHQ